ncbi:uncharacterized protein C16orf46 homolog [Acipenser ruthenus]|uniref:uncharacterized protein C16orf46 homolog n=1 Tax=Acipenser ruthenus TaxID=7906 RepID=UPI002741708D|nr:uncharacterized protein C16orf46 homolog [Acipenser ruthenus]XP_058849683.1 uncharacterized protein C16orf46 homolog [Acipenser ruthenus]XP_058849684.1 uncharacterized protein C16orf46 homolog [Acipenser ruthenus]
MELNESDRKCVDALLDFSEELSRRDEDPFECYIHSGWGDVTQGWGMSSPFACFQIQKKNRKSKQADTGYHCLLCLAAVQQLSEQNSPKGASAALESSKPACRSADNALTESPLAPVIYRSRSCTASTPIRGNSSLKANSMNQLLSIQAKEQSQLCKGKSEDAEASAPEETANNLNDKLVRCQSTKETGRSEALVINSFAVLPPVKPASPSYQRRPSSAKKSEIIVSPSTANNRTTSSRSDRTPKAEERKDDTPGTQKDLNQPQDGEISVASLMPRAPAQSEPGLWHWQSPYIPSKQLLTAYRIHTAKKTEASFSTTVILHGRGTRSSGRNLKQEDLSTVTFNKNGQNHKLLFGLKPINIIRGTDPPSQQTLPVLSGTRVPIPVSSHRLL